MLLTFGDGGLHFRYAFTDASPQCRDDVVDFEVHELAANPAFEVGDLCFDLDCALFRRGHPFGRGGGVEGVPLVVGALGAEEGGGEEREQRVVEPMLVQVHVGRVAGGDVLRALVGGLAGIVRRVAAVVAPHAQPADPAAEQAAVEVVGLRARSCRRGGDALTGAFVGLGARLDGIVLLARNDRRVGRLFRPDPGLGRVGPVVALLSCSAVPDLVAGVLRVAQHFPDAGPAPRTTVGRRVDRHRRRVAVGVRVRVRVQAITDLEEAHPAPQVPVVDGAHDGGAHRVQLQGALVGAAGRLVRVGVVVGDEAVPVEGDAAGVPTLAGRGLLALAGLHHQLVVIAPRDADVHVAQHDRAEGLLHWLVGRVQTYPGRSQLVFDPEGDRGVAAEAADRLHDHPVEATRSAARVGERLLEAAVSRDGDVEAGEAARATCWVGAVTGLDVVVVGDDPPAGLGHLSLGVLQLARKGER